MNHHETLRTSAMTAMAAAIATALATSSALADARPNGIFSDHMVLQRGRAVPVWGIADPGEPVQVRFAGHEQQTMADAKGRWDVSLPAMEWSAEPRDLAVAGRTNEVIVSDVLVGDVWLVSGQSNAEMSFSWGILNGAAEKARAIDFPNIRQVKFRHETALHPQDGDPCCDNWKVATEKTLDGITAEGYFMARELNERTGIPQGILDDNWSGSIIEPFVNDEGMALVPQLAPAVAKVKACREDFVKWAKKIVEAEKEGDWAAVGKIPTVDRWTPHYNMMIAPITKFPIAGATWYQGCSNGNEGMEYARKLEALVKGWRAAWGYDFPFYIVQLASFTAKTTDPAGGNGYARIRDAQRVAAQTIPGCGLAVAIDIGNPGDIHPKNKFDVGHRLALWALRDIYGEKDIVVSGPLFKSMKVESNAVRIEFDYVGGGLMAAEKGPDTPGVAPVETPDAPLKGFAVAGADRRWVWADARIDGDTVVVSAEGVEAPVAVRYAHRANPMGDCNLYNRAGLPASPFRTDAW